MPQLKLPNGHDIYYEVKGEGVPLVALRGLGRSMRHWLGYEARMAKHFKVITIDARGVGRSGKLPGWMDTVYDLAGDVAAVLDELHIPQAHVLGVSLGGMVALAFGLRFEERCRSVISINASIGGLLSLRISPRAIFSLLAGAANRNMRHELLARSLVGEKLPKSRHEKLVDDWRKIDEEERDPSKTVVRQLLSAVRFTQHKDLRVMKRPVLVMYGTKDRFVPNRNSVKIAKLLPNCKLVAIAGGGHEITIDRPNEVLAEIKTWIHNIEGGFQTSTVRNA